MKNPIKLKSCVVVLTIFSFFVSSFISPFNNVFADQLLLPKPGVRVGLSPEYRPPVLKGIQVYPSNPFKFDFILDRGEVLESDPKLKIESAKLVRYFLSSLTTPNQDLWVNLSPYEKNMIIPESFGLTEMGRDLLAQDYLLKQITSSLMYPEEEFGKKLWARIYQEADKQGVAAIPVNAFNKVWIVPDKVRVYEKGNKAFILNARLKVMMENDYLAENKNLNNNNDAEKSTDLEKLKGLSLVIKETIIPELEKEVNEGKNFAMLRQVYQSLILATWFKKRMKDSILGHQYMNQRKVNGIGYFADQEINPKSIYEQYLKAFKKGVYNYIKTEQPSISNEPIPRKYFAGGFAGQDMEPQIDFAQQANPSELPDSAKVSQLSVNLSHKANDNAMAVKKDLPMQLRGQVIAQQKFNEVLSILQSRSEGSQAIWEITDLDNFEERLDELKQLVDLPYEIGLVLTDEGRWVLYTGTGAQILYGKLEPLFNQGRILIDIHTHPRKLDSGDQFFPSLQDLDSYMNYGNFSLIFNTAGISFVSRPIQDPETKSDLSNLGKSFVWRLGDWLKALREGDGYVKPSTEPTTFKDATHSEYRRFMNDAGINFEVIAWEDKDKQQNKIREFVRKASDFDPLKKFESLNKSEKLQANAFIENRIWGLVPARRFNWAIDYIKQALEASIAQDGSVDINAFNEKLNYGLSTEQAKDLIDLYNMFLKAQAQDNAMSVPGLSGLKARLSEWSLMLGKWMGLVENESVQVTHKNVELIDKVSLFYGSYEVWEQLINEAPGSINQGIDFNELYGDKRRVFVIGDTNHGDVSVQGALVKLIEDLHKADVKFLLVEGRNTWLPHVGSEEQALAKKYGIEISVIDIPVEQRVMAGINPTSKEGSRLRSQYMGMNVLKKVGETDGRIAVIVGYAHIRDGEISKMLRQQQVGFAMAPFLTGNQRLNGNNSGGPSFIDLSLLLDKLLKGKSGSLDLQGIPFEDQYSQFVLFMPLNELSSREEFLSRASVAQLGFTANVSPSPETFAVLNVKSNGSNVPASFGGQVLTEPSWQAFPNEVDRSGDQWRINNADKIIKFVWGMQLSDSQKIYLSGMLMGYVNDSSFEQRNPGSIVYLGFDQNRQVFQLGFYDSGGYKVENVQWDNRKINRREVGLKNLIEMYGFEDIWPNEVENLPTIEIINKTKNPAVLIRILLLALVRQKYPERVRVNDRDRTITVLKHCGSKFGSSFWFKISIDELELTDDEERLLVLDSIASNNQIWISENPVFRDRIIAYWESNSSPDLVYRILNAKAQLRNLTAADYEDSLKRFDEYLIAKAQFILGIVDENSTGEIPIVTVRYLATSIFNFRATYQARKGLGDFPEANNEAFNRINSIERIGGIEITKVITFSEQLFSRILPNGRIRYVIFVDPQDVIKAGGLRELLNTTNASTSSIYRLVNSGNTTFNRRHVLTDSSDKFGLTLVFEGPDLGVLKTPRLNELDFVSAVNHFTGQVMGKADLDNAIIASENSKLGGIDLTEDKMKMDIEKEDKLKEEPFDFKALENMTIDGLFIKELEIKPIRSLPALLEISG